MNKSLKKALVAHTLSKYDVFLFGFLASIIKPLFFPASEFIANLAMFASFAAGYLIRPIGAIYFSHIGDRYGRKDAFMRTVLFMMFPTFIITFLPGYEYIGLAAPVILIGSRLVQGFGSGGEFSGVAVYGVELVKKDRGFTGGLIRSVGFLGTAIGTAIASLMTLSFMPSWAWRISFLIGATATLYSYFLRKRMEESKYFEEIKEKDQIEKVPFFTLVKMHKFRIITIFLVSACAYVFLYFSTIYMNSLYSDKFGFTPTSNLVISTIIMLSWMIITPISGIIADKIGLLNLLTRTAWFGLFSTPIAFYIAFNNFSYMSIFCLQMFLTLCGGMFFGAVPALFKEIFPTEVRYTGTSFSNTLAQATIGSLSPFYASLIVGISGVESMVGVVVFISILLGLVGLTLCKRYVNG